MDGTPVPSRGVKPLDVDALGVDLVVCLVACLGLGARRASKA
jgi:hypothetical protein